MKYRVLNGIDRPDEMDKLLKGQRIGLITGGAAVDRNLDMAVDVLRARYSVARLFSTVLGVRDEYVFGEKTLAYTDAPSGLEAHSVFHRDRVAPDEALTRDIDVIVFDIKEAGARYYEYLAVAANALKACAALKKPFVVLDRAAPIGGERVEGTVCPPGMHTIVGDYRLATRTAMTTGEFCSYVNCEYGIGCDLHIVRAEGWERWMYYDDTDLPWVLPSPSLPSVDANILYVGMCLFEGVGSVSEGRGTSMPFSLIGAPWMDAAEIVRRMRGRGLPGARFGQRFFKPTAGKHAGTVCSGILVDIADRATFESFRTALALLDEIRALHGDLVTFRDCGAGHDISEPASEPAFDLYIDKLLATKDYTSGRRNADALTDAYARERAEYAARKAKYHLY